MKKKIVALFAVVLAVICIFGVTACNKTTYSETFTGALSEQSYTDEDEAAKAFLANEVTGSTATAVFVSYNKLGDLTADELAALDIPGDIRSQIDSAEKGEVEYTEATRARAVDNDLTESTKKQGVYIFKIGSTYRYFVPVQHTGEYITKSYFESVFDVNKYKNYTVQVKSIAEARGQNSYESQDAKAELDYTYKVSETAIQLTLNQKYYEFGKQVADKSVNNATVYIIQTDNGLRAFQKVLFMYSEISLSQIGLDSISSIDEIFSANLPSFIDQTYFEKTDSGFAIRQDKLDEFIDNYINEVFADLFRTYPGFKQSMTFDADTSYFVTDGRLSKGTAALTMNGTYYGSDFYASASAECNYSNFGKTKVSIPSGIKSQL